jgi:hypothetical protein
MFAGMAKGSSLSLDPNWLHYNQITITGNFGHQKALIAVARKMLVSIYYVLTRNEWYDGHREDVRTRKIKNMKRLARN